MWIGKHLDLEIRVLCGLLVQAINMNTIADQTVIAIAVNAIV